MSARLPCPNSQLVFLPPSLFDRAEAAGYDMWGFRKVQLIPVVNHWLTIRYEGCCLPLGRRYAPVIETRNAVMTKSKGYSAKGNSYAERHAARKAATAAVQPTGRSREECIAQIYAVADSWGMQRPVITERTSTASLQKYCAKLDREGAKLGGGQ